MKTKEKWKYLKDCCDFEELKEHLSDEILDDFEKEIEYYLNDKTNLEYDSFAVCWYEGMISTEDLISEYNCYIN